MHADSSNHVTQRISGWPFARTLAFVARTIVDAGMTVFARIDHSAGARAIGIALPESTVLIYGNPRIGTPALTDSPLAALELPLRLLVCEDQGRVIVALQPVCARLVNAGVSLAVAEILERGRRVVLDALSRLAAPETTTDFKKEIHMSISEKVLRIDIPVKLAALKSVFSVGAVVFEGDLPASLFHLQLIQGDIDAWNAKAEVIAVFHTNAGHVMLHDSAYNTERNIATGNPYKQLVRDLQQRGVSMELCGATAKAHHWGNEDLLPDIKVNTDAMARTAQLVQDGFVKITE